MPFESFQTAVDALKDIGVDRIQLVGGEPLMHSQFEQLLAYVAGKFSFIEVFTNGTLLNDRLLKLLKECGASLALSVYSESPAIHDEVTQTPGSYALTEKYIKKALDYGIAVRIASVEMKNVPAFDSTVFPVPHKTDFPRLTGRANLALYSRDMIL